MRKVDTRNGERLEIASPKLGHRIRLDALELEALSWQDHRSLSRLLERPLGPSAGPGSGERPGPERGT